MAFEVVMPRLGWTMEEGTFLEWLKQDGETVHVGEILFTAETDKAVNEVEALEAGILRIPPDSPSSGTVLPVGALLAYIVKVGERAPFETESISAPTKAQAVPTPEPIREVVPHTNGSVDQPERSGEPAISPRARRIALELGVDWRDLRGSGSTGRIIERDVRAAHAALMEAKTSMPQVTPETPLRVTPLARRVAEELSVDLSAISPTGKRITRAEVEAAAKLTPQSDAPLAEGEQLIPITAVRRITAERMSESAHTTAPVTLTAEIDATELVALRNSLKRDAEKSGRIVPSYNALFAKLCAEALLEHPMMNTRFAPDQHGIITSSSAHIGIAVDTDRGLLVPVLRDVQNKNVRRIAAELDDLITRARAGTLKPDDMRGGTFTITNLGMFGIDSFTPIINLPECAILGIGRMVPKQVVIDAEAEKLENKLAIRHMMFLSLTFDHRLVDGAHAARFMARIRENIEQPYLFLT